MDTVAEIVNEWFQTQPTDMQQRDRAALIRELQEAFDVSGQRAFLAGYRDAVAEAKRAEMPPVTP
jgi:hypothetical protein